MRTDATKTALATLAILSQKPSLTQTVRNQLAGSTLVLDQELKKLESEAGDRQRAIAMEIEEWMKKVNPYPELNGDQLRDLREIVQRLWSDE